jgi:hypothetical protein
LLEGVMIWRIAPGRRFRIQSDLLSSRSPRESPPTMFGTPGDDWLNASLPKIVGDGTSGRRVFSIGALPVRMPPPKQCAQAWAAGPNTLITSARRKFRIPNSEF